MQVYAFSSMVTSSILFLVIFHLSKLPISLSKKVFVGFKKSWSLLRIKKKLVLAYLFYLGGNKVGPRIEPKPIPADKVFA